MNCLWMPSARWKSPWLKYRRRCRSVPCGRTSPPVAWQTPPAMFAGSHVLRTSRCENMGHPVRASTKIVQHRLHLACGMRVACAPTRGQPRRQARFRRLRLPHLQHRLCRHLVRRHIVRVVLRRGLKLLQSLFVASLGGVGHGQPVTGKAVRGVLRKDLGKHCDLVHSALDAGQPGKKLPRPKPGAR